MLNNFETLYNAGAKGIRKTFEGISDDEIIVRLTRDAYKWRLRALRAAENFNAVMSGAAELCSFCKRKMEHNCTRCCGGDAVYCEYQEWLNDFNNV